VLFLGDGGIPCKLVPGVQGCSCWVWAAYVKVRLGIGKIDRYLESVGEREDKRYGCALLDHSALLWARSAPMQVKTWVTGWLVVRSEERRVGKECDWQSGSVSGKCRGA